MKCECQAFNTLHYAVLTDNGKVREVNEDVALIERWPDGSALLSVIADGMGGQQGGAIASQLVVDTFRTLLDQPLPLDRRSRYEFLLGGFYRAQEAIKERSITDFNLRAMGSTAIAAIIQPEEFLFLYAGDCRLYHFSGENDPFVTRDHSVVSVLIDAGQLTPEQANGHPLRAVVTSSIGASSQSRLCIDPSWDESSADQPAFRHLIPGDRLLFCSDGLHSEVALNDLLALVGDFSQEPQVLAQSCINAALDSSGSDNVTVIVIDVASQGA